jgi:hypothetical protein
MKKAAPGNQGGLFCSLRHKALKSKFKPILCLDVDELPEISSIMVGLYKIIMMMKVLAISLGNKILNI